MKVKRKLLTTGCILFGSLMVIATPLTIVSCSSGSQIPSNSKIGQEISVLTNEYRTQLDGVIKAPREFYQYTSDDLNNLLDVCNKYLSKAHDIIQNNNNLNIDETIWIKSLIEEIEVKKQIFDSKIHLLIVDKNDRLAFTNYSGVLTNSINTAFNKFESYVKNNDIETALNYLNEFKSFITKIKMNLKEGQNEKITMSGVMTKHSLGNLFQNSFRKILEYYVDNSSSTPTFNDLETNNLLPFTAIAKNNDISDSNTLQIIKTIDQFLMQFLNYLTNDYYASIEYGRSDNKNTPYQLSVLSNDPNEEDNGFSYKNKYIQGLGLSTTDLNTKDVGVGFTPNVEFAKKIYNALIKKHSSTNNTTTEIFNIGNNAVKEIKNNMKEVAKIVAEVYVGKNNDWSPKGEYYDSDSSGNDVGAVLADNLLTNIVTSTGEVDLSKFFIWMNTNRWFNGRDMRNDQFPTINGQTPILSKYLDQNNPINNWEGRAIPYIYEAQFTPKNSGITSVKISDVIGDYKDYMDESYVVNKNLNNNKATIVDGDAGNLAYKYLVKGLSPATIQSSSTITNNQQTNSISPEAAFIGTSKAINQYLQFKDTTAKHISDMFLDTSIDYTLRTGTGGAAYANSGEGSWSYSSKGWGGFYLDTNPYYGLQKWSMSTLSIHEAISGHVFQFNYAHDHPAVSYAPSFRSTAYSEGWGLFSEWLAVLAGIYGEPVVINDSNDNQLALPKFGVNSKGFDVTQFKNKDDYANGAYWVEDDKTTPEIKQENSQTLYDAVQYFGFLNERQLRAMRCAVDVCIHAGGATIDSSGDVTNTTGAGEYKKGTGWSLNEARKYLQSNSGLGLDDIKRETKRYLEYTGQAVSYYNGTIAIQKLYTDASIKYTNTYKKDFLNWQSTISTKNNTQGLFDVILRNGSIPIDVVVWAGQQYINSNFNA